MSGDILGAIGQATMITAFVAVMMIAVEYANVLTRGTFERVLRGSPALQYLAAALLGATPGCLGAFTIVALYSHRVVTVGAVVAAMIATSGDEAFVMLGLFPGTAIWLMAGLALLGFAIAPVIDRLAGDNRFAPESCTRLTIHPSECECFPRHLLISQWQRPIGTRVTLTLALTAFTLWIITGGPGVPENWDWVRVTLVGVGGLGAFIVGTVPDHFLREHLWRHVIARHVPRTFAWTVTVLAGVTLLQHFVDLDVLVRRNPLALLAAAGLLGLIPESGPHLVFVSLYAAGGLPISILVASSIVQDGHGMLPLLAQSPRDFVRIKAVNLLVGLVVGGLLLASGL
jgi:hypothetical protein